VALLQGRSDGVATHIGCHCRHPAWGFYRAIVRVVYLPNPNHFKLFAACVLLHIGLKMVRGLLEKNSVSINKNNSEKRFQEMGHRHRSNTADPEILNNTPLQVVKVTHFNLKRLNYTFYDETFSVPFWGIFTLSFMVGIGGGSIIAPFLITFFELPVYTVAGAALMGTFVTSVAGVAFYQGIALYYPNMSVAPDWFLGLLFGVGGMAGMYLGARCQKFVPAKLIKWMLAAVIVFTALKYVIDFLV
jgi:uncharacterized protein